MTTASRLSIRHRTTRLVALALLLALVGCRGDTTPPPPTTPAPGETAAAATPAAVGISGRCAETGRIAPADELAPRCFELTADDADAAGVAPGTSFTLASMEALAPETVAGLLVVEPAVPLEVEPLAGQVALGPARAVTQAPTRFAVRPAERLAEGTIYRFRLLESPEGRALTQWAFQVRAPLRVVGTSPADGQSDVPVDTGIELTFSHPGVSGIEERLSIEPPVDGTLETHRRTVVFVPADPFAPGTLYTVRLDAGVAVPDSALVLEQPLVLRFETAAEEAARPQAQLDPSHRTWEVPTDETPVLSYFGFTDQPGGTLAGREVAVDVRRYGDAAAFVGALDAFAGVPDWAFRTRERYEPAVEGLAPAATFTTTLEPIGDFGEFLVRFPEPLSEGFYLVQLTLGERSTAAWLQVTDIAGYAAVSTTRLLVWANVVGQGPAAGAAVRTPDGTLETTTDDEGMAFVETPAALTEETEGSFGPRVSGHLIVETDGGTAVLPVDEALRSPRAGGLREFFGASRQPYWRYLYTDRALYRLTDEVRFWGLVRPQDEGEAPEALTVEVVDGSGFDSTWQGATTVARTTVTPGPRGTFIGRLAFERASPGWYTLQVRHGETTITSKSIEIQDFVTPAYQIEVTSSAQAVFAGQPLTLTAEAAFFEGSPVPGMALDVAGDHQATLTTDARGRATTVLTPTIGSDSEARFQGYRWLHAGVGPAGPEAGDIGRSVAVQVFPARVDLSAQPETLEETAEIDGRVYGVDLEPINSGRALGPDDFEGAPAPGRVVTAEVTEIRYERVEVGQTYDFVTKEVRPQYRYDPVRTPLGTFEAASGEDGAYTVSFPVEPGRSYEAELTVEDDDGRAAQRVVWVSGDQPQAFDQPQLALDDDGPFALGDDVGLTMQVGDRAPPTGDLNRYLFYQARSGIRDYTLSDTPRLELTFGEAHVPSISVVAVRFSGRTYQEVPYPQMVRFDPEARRLTVRVTPDRERYAPGDAVTLDVEVTDAEGQPAAAEVLLSAIDEAVYQMRAQSVAAELDILGSLYEPVSGGVLSSYASHQMPEGAAGAEGGGGGGERTVFEDTALFETVQTDADGRATVQFEVPDNLTSWRVSAIGVTDGLSAGSSVTLVPVGLPFFVDLTAADTYLTDDVPQLRLRAFGDALAAGDPVSFTLEAPTLLDGPVSVEGVAFAPVTVTLEALTAGRHEVTARAAAGEHADALVRPIEVVPSRLLRVAATYDELAPGEALDLEPGSGQPVELVLADHNRGRYFGPLQELAWLSGDRSDQALSRVRARELLRTHFGVDAPLGDVFYPSTYQRDDGGIAPLPFADSELPLSVRAALSAPDGFGRQGLVRYLGGIVNDPEETRERVTMALAGLAALDQPVLPELEALAAAEDLSPAERLHVGLGLARLGAESQARAVYRALVDEAGEPEGDALRLAVGDDRVEMVESTALGALLGALVAANDAPALFQYTVENRAAEATPWLEQVAFLAAALPRLSAAPVRVSYTFEGARETRTLAGGESVTLRLTADGLAALDLAVEEGTLGVSSAQLTALDPADVTPAPGLEVRRSYAVAERRGATYRTLSDEDDTWQIGADDLVRVTLEYDLGADAPDGCHQLSDLLPTGLRAVTRPYRPYVFYESDPADIPYAVANQRVSFCVFREADAPRVRYLARVAGTGRFVAEPALLQPQRAPENVALTSARTVEVR